MPAKKKRKTKIMPKRTKKSERHGRMPSNKSKTSKVRKLIRLAKKK